MSLFQTLKPKPKSSAGSSCCLLLDISGSMDITVATESEDGLEPRRIDLLFRAVRDTPECSGLKAFMFNTRCYPVECIPDPAQSASFVPTGSTNLEDAFMTVKAAGFYNAILVTDGVPDSAEKSLAAASGMKLGIIYIGNPPVPLFLQRLAEATNGTFQIADLAGDIKQLEDAIMRALPPPKDETPPTGGTINL